MKTAGLILLAAIGSAIPAPAEDSARGLVSQEIKAHIREDLPKYLSSPPGAEGARDEATPVTDPGVLVLPTLTVQEKRFPADAADRLMSRRDFRRKLENIYDDALEAEGLVSRVLNYLTIPLISPSKAQRGFVIYKQREVDRLRHVNAVSRRLAPEVADKFEQELDNHLTTDPAGLH